uniref:Uncharacterized protein n=1 Tax=Latimeria chalumnae TaxID=7897 RepID=H3B3C1_LATCH
MFSLSLLSRGCGQVTKNNHEKLDVYFEPKDYFNWKSSQLVATHKPLSSVYCTYEHWNPALRKTFSTRKGALILYSEDLALSSWQPRGTSKGWRGHGSHRKKLKVQLHTLKDLTGAILAYGNKQVNRHMID